MDHTIVTYEKFPIPTWNYYVEITVGDGKHVINSPHATPVRAGFKTEEEAFLKAKEVCEELGL